MDFRHVMLYGIVYIGIVAFEGYLKHTCALIQQAHPRRLKYLQNTSRGRNGAQVALSLIIAFSHCLFCYVLRKALEDIKS